MLWRGIYSCGGSRMVVYGYVRLCISVSLYRGQTTICISCGGVCISVTLLWIVIIILNHYTKTIRLLALVFYS